MINPEKLLGGLLMGRGGVFSGRSTIGMGLLGIAMEAAEHYMNQSASPPPAPPTAPPAPPASPPGSAVPPPPPGSSVKTGATSTPAARPGDAVLLIRAMIAAANADGGIDADERRRILEGLQKANLNAAEQAFITQELSAPCDMETIARQVKTPRMAEQVYAASLAAITVDTRAEREYLRRLARRLDIDDTSRQRISARLAGTG